MSLKRPLPGLNPALTVLALALGLLLSVVMRAGTTAQSDDSIQLLMRLPSSINTPDGAALAPNGDIILSVPNFNNDALMKDERITASAPERMVRIDARNELTTWYTFSQQDKHPDTGRIGPMDGAFGPDGNLYVADMQIFWDGAHKSRVLRINVKNGKAVGMDVVVEGFIVANGMVWKGDTLFVTDTILRHSPPTEAGKAKPPLLSGVYGFKLEELGRGPVRLIPYGEHHSDPHLVLRLASSNRIGFGADGVTIDGAGNLYTSVIEDGVIYKARFDEDGRPLETTLFARSDQMRSADGIVWREKDGRIYVADMLLNAVHAIDANGDISTLHRNGDTDGSDGLLDQPAEVILRGDELIVVNMDMPWTDPHGYLTNTTIDEPYTLSVITLD
jgi:sugar lactone lactonase YvrE